VNPAIGDLDAGMLLVVFWFDNFLRGDGRAPLLAVAGEWMAETATVALAEELAGWLATPCRVRPQQPSRRVGVGPARRGPPRPRGSAFGLVPGEVLAARIISARTPVPYPRMKTGSRVPDARLMASNFCTRPSRPTIHWRSIGVSSRRLAPPGPPTSEEVGHLLKDGYT